MTTRIVLSVLIAALMELSVSAQAPVPTPVADPHVDAVDGLSRDQAIARALEQEVQPARPCEQRIVQ